MVDAAQRVARPRRAAIAIQFVHPRVEFALAHNSFTGRCGEIAIFEIHICESVAGLVWLIIPCEAFHGVDCPFGFDQGLAIRLLPLDRSEGDVRPYGRRCAIARAC